MSREEPRPIEPPGWPRPKGYAHGMLAPAGARLLAIAGQVAWDEGEKIVSADFVEQFERALRNVLAVLAAAGGRAEHLVRLTFYVTDKEEYRRSCRAIGERYVALVGRRYVACTLVEVKGLLEPGARVEIEATAALPPP
jgi:enamine deaminase RidA (YjgF/YER057c/UK114 family)